MSHMDNSLHVATAWQATVTHTRSTVATLIKSSAANITTEPLPSCTHCWLHLSNHHSFLPDAVKVISREDLDAWSRLNCGLSTLWCGGAKSWLFMPLYWLSFMILWLKTEEFVDLKMRNHLWIVSEVVIEAVSEMNGLKATQILHQFSLELAHFS